MKKLITLFTILLGGVLIAQDYPQDYFRSPLDIPLYLSGNFGELRSNHFHAGIDIKTEGVEGKKVYAAAEGYVYRIKIQEYGYGKVLYIKHPNGYSTTYAHLKNFSPEIEAYIKKKQYEKESYTIEVFPSPQELPVQKGDIIAFSGNTGGSGGPHLHFEIRDVKNDHALNPLLFNLPIKDETKPKINGIKIYPLSEDAYLGSKPNPQYFRTSGINGNYQLNFKDTIRVHGSIGIGIDLNDYLDGSHNRCGIYTIELYIRDSLIHQQKMERIPFDKSRYINTHCDFEERCKSKKWVQKCFKEKNNLLNIYPISINNGIIPFYNEEEVPLKIVVKDSYLNTSELSFKLKSKRNPLEFQHSKNNRIVAHFPYNETNEFKTDSFEVYFPSHTFYDDLDFEFHQKPNNGKVFSDFYQIHQPNVANHKYFTIRIKPDSIIPGKEHQMLMASYGANGHYVSEGGSWDGEYIKAKSRTFGTYFIYVDSIPPKIRPLNISEGKNMSNNSAILIRIEDNFSGIQSYKAYIDGQWILMEYDYKKKQLVYTFDEKIEKGEHQMILTVLDGRGNKSIFTVNFTR